MKTETIRKSVTLTKLFVCFLVVTVINTLRATPQTKQASAESTLETDAVFQPGRQGEGRELAEVATAQAFEQEETHHHVKQHQHQPEGRELVEVTSKAHGNNQSQLESQTSKQQSLRPQKPILSGPQKRKPIPRRIHLLRVPKAGSSSLSAFLRLQYDCINKEHPFGDCTRHNQELCGAVKGCTRHTNNHLIDDGLPWITMLRDPIKRYVSAFYYPGHHGRGTRGLIDLHTTLFPEWNNTQVNFFAGRLVGDWFGVEKVLLRQYAEAAEQQNNNQTMINVPPLPTNHKIHHEKRPEWMEGRIPKWIVRTHSKQAKENLPAPWALLTKEEKDHRLQIALDQIENKAAFVGLLEYFDDSLRLFCRIYDCPHPIEEALMKSSKNKQRSNKKALVKSPKNKQRSNFVGHGEEKKDGDSERQGGMETNATDNLTPIPSEHANLYPYNDEVAMEAIRGANSNDIILYKASLKRLCTDLLSFQEDDEFWETISQKTKTKCSEIKELVWKKKVDSQQ